MSVKHPPSVSLSLTVKDAAAALESYAKAYQKALAAGAASVAEPEDHFWGTRDAVIRDPYGYRWAFGQKIEDLIPDEVAERAKKLFGG